MITKLAENQSKFTEYYQSETFMEFLLINYMFSDHAKLNQKNAFQWQNNSNTAKIIGIKKLELGHSFLNLVTNGLIYAEQILPRKKSEEKKFTVQILPKGIKFLECQLDYISGLQSCSN